MTVMIRPRREEDLPALAAVLVRVHELDGYPVEGVANPEDWLRQENEIQSWTALEDGKPIGQITLTLARPDDDAAKAWHKHTGNNIDQLAIPARLFVDPTHRGTGAGRKLMQKAIDHAAQHTLAIAFDVMLKDNRAIRLYNRLGATMITEITHHYGEGKQEAAAVYTIPSARTQ